MTKGLQILKEFDRFKAYWMNRSAQEIAVFILWKLKQIEGKMDKQIAKVKKDVVKGDKSKAKKDIKTLQKMDKKFDKKIHKAEKVMKKGKC